MATTPRKISMNALRARVAQPAMEKNAAPMAAEASAVNASQGRRATRMVYAKKEMRVRQIALANNAALMAVGDNVEFAMLATSAHKANVLTPTPAPPYAMVKHVARMVAEDRAAHVKPMKFAKAARVRNPTVHLTV